MTESILRVGRVDNDKDEPEVAADASDSTLEGLTVLKVSLPNQKPMIWVATWVARSSG